MNHNHAPSSNHETQPSPDTGMEFSADDLTQASAESVQDRQAEAEAVQDRLAVGKDEKIDDARQDVLDALTPDKGEEAQEQPQLSTKELDALILAKEEEINQLQHPQFPKPGKWGTLRMMVGMRGVSSRQMREHEHAQESYNQQWQSLYAQKLELEGKVNDQIKREHMAEYDRQEQEFQKIRDQHKSPFEGEAVSYVATQKETQRDNKYQVQRVLDLAAGPKNERGARKVMDRWKEYAARGDYDGFTSEESIKQMMKDVGRDSNNTADYVSFLNDMNDIKKLLSQ